MCSKELPAPTRRKSTSTQVLTSRDRGKRACPHCGASISRTAKVCTLCEQPVQPLSPATRVDKGRTALLSLLGTKDDAKARGRQLDRRCPSCGARVGGNVDICPMCDTDLNLAAVEQAVQGEALAAPEQEMGPELDIVSQHAAIETQPSTGVGAQRACISCGAFLARTAKQCTVCGAEVREAVPSPLPPQARQRLPVVWIGVVAGVLVAAVLVVAGRAYWPGRPTPTPTAVPVLVSKPPTETAISTPTMTPPTMTPTPRPTGTATSTPKPTATPTSTATPTATPTPIVHIVRSGETLYSIARDYDVSVAALSEANELTTTSYLHPDDELIIPAPVEDQVPTATAPPDEIVHTVQEGERLGDIAQRYGVSEQELRKANNLEADAGVRSGDTLIVPVDNGPTPTATLAPTATPTPGLPYAAPHLLYPLHNAEFQGAAQVVTLQWTSAGILEADEWYALSLRYLGSRAGGQPSAITIYTRITSWRVPNQWYPDQQASERRFDWTVQVVRRPDLGASSTAISPQGDVRRFRWQ